MSIHKLSVFIFIYLLSVHHNITCFENMDGPEHDPDYSTLHGKHSKIAVIGISQQSSSSWTLLLLLPSILQVSWNIMDLIVHVIQIAHESWALQIQDHLTIYLFRKISVVIGWATWFYVQDHQKAGPNTSGPCYCNAFTWVIDTENKIYAAHAEINVRL